MPLIICTVVFIALFSFEGFWHLADLGVKEQALRRYQAVEHPRRKTSDEYLDRL